MTDQMQTIFEPLKQAIIRAEHTDADLCDLIGGFILSQPVIAQAIAFHARDYLVEQAKNTLTYSEIIAEVYRRTFFDKEKSHLYGTEFIFNQGPAALKLISQNLVANLNMDQVQLERGGYVETGTTQH